MSGDRRRLAAASFGPEWEPFGQTASWLLRSNTTPRGRARMAAHMREARRELAAAESRVRS